MLIQSFFDTLRLIDRFEDYEQGMAAAHAFCHVYSKDTTLCLTEDFEEIRLSSELPLPVMAKCTMHGLYDKVNIRYRMSTGGCHYSAKLFGTKELPYDCGILIPCDGGVVTVSDSCSFESSLLLPRGIYRGSISDCGEIESSPEFPDLLPQVRNYLENIKENLQIEDYVYLSASDTVPDRLITARYVLVDSSFRSSVQIFATDSVVVSNGASLMYPSGISGDASRCTVRIEENAMIEGYVVMTPMSGYSKHVVYAQSESSVLRGLVYVDGKAQLKGIISGAAYVRHPVEVTDKGEVQWSISGLRQINNEIMAFPNIFGNNYERKLIKDYEEYQSFESGISGGNYGGISNYDDNLFHFVKSN